MAHISFWFMPMMLIYWEGRVRTIRENADASFLASKENGLELKTDNTKYMVMSRDQNAERNHNIENDNSFFERVKEFKYLGTALTNKNSIQKKLSAD